MSSFCQTANMEKQGRFYYFCCPRSIEVGGRVGDTTLVILELVKSCFQFFFYFFALGQFPRSQRWTLLSMLRIRILILLFATKCTRVNTQLSQRFSVEARTHCNIYYFMTSLRSKKSNLALELADQSQPQNIRLDY